MPLLPLFRFAVRRPLIVLAVALLVSAGCLTVALNLRIDTDFARLLPESYPSVQALEDLQAMFGGESAVEVVVEGPAYEENLRVARQFIDEALASENEAGEAYFTRAEFEKDVSFVQNNALYFATDAELDQLETYLRDQIEDSRLDANPFFFDLEDDFDDEFDDEFEDEPAEEEIDFDEAYRAIVPKPIPVSDDSTTLVVRLYPSGSLTNIGSTEGLYDYLGTLAAPMESEQIEISLAGRPLQQVIQIRSITNDVTSSFTGGVLTVLLMVALYFLFKFVQQRGFRPVDLIRTPFTALLIGVPLVMSLTWTFAITYALFGVLNLMTSILVLVLFGLGVDYGIHFVGRYAEERGEGKSTELAMETTFVSSGPPIATSAFTTAASLFVLVIADFQGFSQFGVIAGVGILFALFSMLFLLPALMVVFERLKLVHFASDSDEERARAVASHEARPFPAAKPVLAVCALALLGALVLVPRVEFEYVFGRLEPTFEEYNELREKTRRVFPASKKRNPAYIIVDGPDEALAVQQALLEEAEGDTTTTILSAETLYDRYPVTPELQARRLARLDSIRSLLADPFLEASDSADLARLRQASQTESAIDLADVPQYLKERFTTKDGELGRFVIVYPSVGLDDGRESMRFANEIGRIETADGNEYFAGSTSIVAATMLELMLEESPLMIGLTALVVLLLMFLVFRSVKWTLLAALPLLVGIVWMLAIMTLVGLKLNFYNLIVLPAVLGIGNDTGIHVVYRYLEEGKGSLLTVLRSTGEHVAVGALTTMVGFAWWMFSYHPGLNTIGELAVIGIGAVLVAALAFLPAVLQAIER